MQAKPWPVALALLSTVVSGCIPVRVNLVDWHARSGRVVDAPSDKAIAGATVTIRGNDTADPCATAITDAKGRFNFPERSGKHWVPLMFDPFLEPPHLLVFAQDHQPIDLIAWDGHYVISLQPEANSSPPEPEWTCKSDS